ncbi:CHASE2 domain-containing protein [Haliangium sp.]|uniref:CHASE2 domain-containing protein n=1 Tax=Haliangium sp. TaxID=2663208 RepID=UPI003D13FB71
MTLLGVLALVWLVDRAGFFDRADAHLRALYYELRGSYSTPDRLVFVAMDEFTGEAWGPPPWSWSRYGEMLSTILAAEPQVVAVLEPGPRVMPAGAPALPDEVSQAVAAGRVILPSTQSGLAQPQLDLSSGAEVEAVVLASDTETWTSSVTEAAIRAAGLTPPAHDRLLIHYLGGPDSLPTVPAHRISTGEIPTATFAGRVVVVGLRGERFAPLVPTPIGPLSPAEVHAYALRGLLLDAVWTPLPSWAWGLLMCALALTCLVLLPRWGLRRSVALVAGLSAGFVAADYALFALGSLRLGATAPIVTMLVAATAAWMGERRRLLRELEALSRWSSRRLAVDNSGRQGTVPLDELWERFARTCRSFTQCESTLLGELPEGTWHVDFELSLGVSPDQIQELRRDIRREPYKSAFLMHRPVWSERFMDTELDHKTLLVPLTSFNRILGLWLINYRKGVEVSSNTLRIIEHLAEQLALTMERRRIRRLLGQRSSVRESLLLRPIHETRNSVQFFAHEQSSLAQMFESLPVGVLVATMWGEIEYVNAAMRRFLSVLHVDGSTQRSLPELLTALTHASEPEVHETVMRLFTGMPLIELSCPDAVDDSYQVTLSSLSDAPLVVADGDAAAAPAEDQSVFSHLVLTVTRRASAADHALPKSVMSGG